MSLLADLHLGAEIGSGSFGKVFRAKWKGKPVAVKTLHEYLFRSDVTGRHVDKFHDECRILQRLDHRNVVQLLEFVISYSSPPVLITELLDCDLRDYINQHHPGKISFPETVSIMLDVAEGLAYIHHRCTPPIIHRDLSPGNVLLTKSTMQAKIGDLGLAKCFSSEKHRMLASPVPGTPAYAAPETYTTEQGNKVEYCSKIDIFSFGVVIMEVINGSCPVMEPLWPFESDGTRVPETVRRHKDIRKMGDHKLSGMVLRCIRDERKARPGAEEIVADLQKDMSKIQQKKAISQRAKPLRPLTLKVVVLGSVGTGKTCIIKRFVHDSYIETGDSTVGQEIYFKGITLNDQEYRLNITDTMGQEKFHSIPQNLLRDAHGLLLVFDLTVRATFDEGVPRMLQFVNDTETDNLSIILVGNKIDADRSRHEVTRQEAEEYAQRLGAGYFETSAKHGHNIDAVFQEIASYIFDTLDLSDIATYFPNAADGRIRLTESDRHAPGREKNVCVRMRNWMCR